MSDNTTLNPGSSGDTIRDIDRGGGVKTQVVQLDIGGAASESLVTGTLPVSGSVNADLRVGGAAVTTSNPIAIQPPLSGFIPVSQSGTWNINNVSGTVSLPTGASTGAKQDTGNTSLSSIDGKVPALGQALAAASVPVVLTAAQLSTLTPLTTIAATQSGAWSTGRTWTLASGTDSITLGALSYPVSTNNSSTAQLASGAAFTGTIETIQNQQAAQIQVVCDQAYTLVINQYQDAAGTKLTSSDTFVRAAGVPYNENVTLPGNYFKLVLTNNGQSPTTTLSIDTTFGIMATGPRTVTALGNNRMAINEIGGNAVTGSSLPVQVTPQQQVDLNSNNLNLLVQQMVSELRITNYLLQQGLNVRDDVDLLRADPYYNPYLNQ